MTHTTTKTTVDATDEIKRARAELGDFVDEDIVLPDSSAVRVSDILDDLAADSAAEEVLDVLAEVAQAGRLH